jgi:hypothetical protein
MCKRLAMDDHPASGNHVPIRSNGLAVRHVAEACIVPTETDRNKIRLQVIDVAPKPGKPLMTGVTRHGHGDYFYLSIRICGAQCSFEQCRIGHPVRIEVLRFLRPDRRDAVTKGYRITKTDDAKRSRLFGLYWAIVPQVLSVGCDGCEVPISLVQIRL